MSRLIPEKRADRNGRVVTRHVLPPGSKSAAASSIPPVQPLRSLTEQSADYRKLGFLYGATSSNDDVHKLYPVASHVARGLEAGGKESIRDLFRNSVDPINPDWHLNFAATCEFISRIGGTSDADMIDIALYSAARYYGLSNSSDLLQADDSVTKEAESFLRLANTSQFVGGAVGHPGTLQADIKREELVKYLCTRNSDGSLEAAVPAIKGIDGFIDFWEDEQEEPAVLDNLNYRELIEFMEDVRNNTGLSPETALSMIRSHGFKVADARDRISEYDGASALIDGSL